MEKRSLVIDSMRGIACIGVVIVHSDMINWNGLCGQVARLGGRGVQIFFIISALLIFKSLENSGCGTKQFNIKRWYYNKFLRLIPLYWTAIICYLFVFGTTYWTTSSNKGIICWTVISDFLFLSGLDPFHLNVFWYLGALGVFTLVAPFLYKVINNWGRAVLLFGSTYAVLNLVVPIFADRINFGYNYEIWSSYWRSHSVFSNLSVLSLGILLYFLYYHEEVHILIKNSANKYNVNIKHISRVVLLCLFLLVAEHVYNGSGLVEYALLFSAMIFNEMVSDNRILTNSFSAFLGKYSYGIYLFHVPVMRAVERVLEKGAHTYIHTVSIVAITIGISIGISFFATNAIERPIISKFKR